jgi:hypothetical protein
MQHPHGPIAVYGANGHTGRFVIAELARRGLPFVAVARDISGLGPGARQARLDDPAALARALAGCSVVIHCAGPFLDTATPLLEVALRHGVSYLDVTAEQGSAQATFAHHDAAAREAGIAVIPAAGFYGGLADLLATRLAQGRAVDRIAVNIALDHWWPTRGTRDTGVRNQLPRLAVEGGRLVPIPQPPRQRAWDFGGAFGEQPMVELPFSETITLSRHLRPRQLHSWLNTTPRPAGRTSTPCRRRCSSKPRSACARRASPGAVRSRSGRPSPPRRSCRPSPPPTSRWTSRSRRPPWRPDPRPTVRFVHHEEDARPRPARDAHHAPAAPRSRARRARSRSDRSWAPPRSMRVVSTLDARNSP